MLVRFDNNHDEESLGWLPDLSWYYFDEKNSIEKVELFWDGRGATHILEID